MPPKPGPPPRRVPHQRILLRRIAAVGGVALAALVIFGIVKLASHGNAASAPPTTSAIVQPKPFRIIFPEGFTREQMGARVRAVAKIAERERHRSVRLDRTAYLAASRSLVVPCFGRKRQNVRQARTGCGHEQTECAAVREAAFANVGFLRPEGERVNGGAVRSK